MEIAGPLFLAHIVESSNDAIIAVNLNSQVTYWNGAAERTLGYTRLEVLGKDLRDLICPHKERDLLALAEDANGGDSAASAALETCECYVEDLATKTTPQIVLRRRKNGESINLLISITPIYASTTGPFASTPAIRLSPSILPHYVTTPPTALSSPSGSDIMSVTSEHTWSSVISNASSIADGIVTGYAAILIPIDYHGDRESLQFPTIMPSAPLMYATSEQPSSTSDPPQIMINTIPPSVSTSSALTNQITQACLSRLYEHTFSQIGREFLESLGSMIASMLEFDCVFVYEVLTYEEWCDLGKKDDMVNGEGDSGLNFSEEASSSSLSLPNMTIAPEEHILCARARWCSGLKYDDSDKAEEGVLPCSILSLAGHPHEWTLSKKKFVVLSDLHTGHPHYQRYESYAALRLDGADGPVGIIGVMDTKPIEMDRAIVINDVMDGVSERVTAEIVRLQSETRLIRAKESAEQDADNKSKFLADMSHEIRTPMNAVIALTDLLLQDRSSLNEEQTEHLEVIQTSGQHLLTVINDILDISKINHDPKFRLESRHFNLRKCVKDTLNMARHQSAIHHANKVIHVLECPPDFDDAAPISEIMAHLHGGATPPLPQVRHGKTLLPLIWKIDNDVPEYVIGDSMRLMQIMINLCSNAVKFTKEGRVRVHIRRTAPISRAPSPSSPTLKMSFKQRYDAKLEIIRSRMRRKSVGKREDKRMEEAPRKAASTPEIVTGDEEGSKEAEGIGNETPLERVVLEFSVTDTGIGIPADRLPRLFKSFSQIDISTARRFGGTGLGLAISSTLVNLMGGAMWVESEEGAGSRFAFTIPLPVYHLLARTASPPSPSSSISDASTGDSSHSISRGLTDPITIIRAPTPSATPSSTVLSSSPSTASYFLHSSSHEPSPSPSHSQTHKRTHSGGQLWSHLGQGLPFHIPGLNSSHENHLQPPGDKLRLPEQQQHLLSPPTHDHSFTQGPEQAQSKRSEGSSTFGSRQHHTKNRGSDENMGVIYPIKILLAEDNVLNQKIAVSILKRLGYPDIDVAINGREVLEMMQIVKYDLILMDLYMPEIDGLEATRKIVSSRPGYKEKRTNVHSGTSTSTLSLLNQDLHLLNVADVYIIALTASASSQDRQTCIDAGMNDFLGKPFTMMEMRAALKNYVHLRKKGKRRTNDEMTDLAERLGRTAFSQELDAGHKEN